MRINRFFATTVSITLLLLLAGVASYLMIGAQKKVAELQSEFVVSIYLRDTIAKVDLLQIESTLNNSKEVESFEFITKEQAAADFAKELNVDFMSMLENNPLPASFAVKLKPSVDVAKFDKTAQTWKGVEEVYYPYELAREVKGGIDQLSYYVVGFSFVLAFVLILVLRNTIKMDVAASSDRIARAVHQRMPIKQIKNPFLLRAYTQGSIAGVLASIALFIVTDGIALSLPIAKLPIDMKLLGVLFAITIITAIALDTLFTLISVNTQINNALKNK